MSSAKNATFPGQCSAIAAVPASGDSWAYISSGTWSLMGLELDAPVINEDVLAANPLLHARMVELIACAEAVTDRQ